MKLRKAIKLAAAGAAIAAIPGVAFAAAGDIPSLTNWTGAGGVIDTSSGGCGSTFTCGTAILDDGFHQVPMTNALGEEFILTINTAAAGGGFGSLGLDGDDQAFADVNVIMLDGMGGIYAKQEMKDNSEGTFTSDSLMGTGMEFMGLVGMGTDGMGHMRMIELNQSVTDQDVVMGVTTDMTAGFNFKHGMNMSGQGTVDYDGKYAIITLTGTASDGDFDSSFDIRLSEVEGVSASVSQAAEDDFLAKDLQLAATLDSGTGEEAILQVFSLDEQTGAEVTQTLTATGDGLSVVFTAGDAVVQLRIDQTLGTASPDIFGLHDFINETADDGKGIDSFTTTGPFWTVGAY